jgi:hypothetical protein
MPRYRASPDPHPSPAPYLTERNANVEMALDHPVRALPRRSCTLLTVACALSVLHRYICAFYDQLPRLSVFLHGHHTSWHNRNSPAADQARLPTNHETCANSALALMALVLDAPSSSCCAPT